MNLVVTSQVRGTLGVITAVECTNVGEAGVWAVKVSLIVRMNVSSAMCIIPLCLLCFACAVVSECVCLSEA